jgi:hypothetical protein
MNTPTSPVHLTAVTVWALRLAGLAALVNGAGFGSYDIPATWHLAHDHEVWYPGENPTYGNGPFEAHGISVTVPVLLAFFGACLLLAIGGALLLVPRTTGVIATLAGILACAPFWWGFDLPFAWFSAANVLTLLAMAWGASMLARPGAASRRVRSPGDRTTHYAPLVPRVRDGAVESRARQRAGWAGAASVALLVVGVALCSLAGVDAPSASDEAILERLDDGAKQTAAGIGLPVLGLGVALLLWFPTGLRRVLDRMSGGDPLAYAIVPAAALLGGLMTTGVALDDSSAITAATDGFTAEADTARALGTAALVVSLSGGAVLVAVTTRIAQQARVVPSWAVWASYVVPVLCLSGFWSAGMASVVFALWLICAVIGLLRSSPAPEAPTTADADTTGSETSAWSASAEHLDRLTNASQSRPRTTNSDFRRRS